MIKILSKFILSKIIGWKVIGSLPVNKKYIIAVVPHSSYFDLIVAVLIRTYSGVKITLFTHDQSGVTEKDIKFALSLAKIY